MKSYVFTGDRNIEVVEKDRPTPGPGQVLIKTKSSSICGTDLHVYRDSAETVSSKGITTSGHEPVGEVAEVGAGVTWPTVGERVVGYHVAGCGVCKFCQIRHYKECPHNYSAPASDPKRIAMQENLDGSNAEYVLLDAGLVLPLPEEFSYPEGSVLVCNFGTAFGAVRNAFTFPGGVLAVWGLGPVGLNVVLVAKAFGLRVIGVDVSAGRRKIAEDLGVEVLDGAIENLTEVIHEMTGGEGPDSIIDTTGVGSVHEILVSTVKRCGTVVLVGLGHATMVGPVPQTILRQVTVKGSWIFDIEDWQPMLQFVKNHNIDLNSTIDKVVPESQFKEAFVEADKALAGKIVFDWS
jgi:threonine dehydrogenase-like Zn-dependent dehydrogenase